MIYCLCIITHRNSLVAYLPNKQHRLAVMMMMALSHKMSLKMSIAVAVELIQTIANIASSVTRLSDFLNF